MWRAALVGDLCQDSGFGRAATGAARLAAAPTGGRVLSNDLQVNALETTFKALKKPEVAQDLVQFLNKTQDSKRLRPEVTQLLSTLMEEHILVRAPFRNEEKKRDSWQATGRSTKLFPPIRSGNNSVANRPELEPKA